MRIANTIVRTTKKVELKISGPYITTKKHPLHELNNEKKNDEKFFREFF